MFLEAIFNTVGGLGLFLFGMGMMSDGLKKVAGQRLKSILESMTRKPILGFSMGMLITALVQSSSATTVMIIGLVNAGLMTLRQAICVILGTNVGTTITAWIVSFSNIDMGALKITSYALPAIGIGFLLQVASKSRQKQNVGLILMGFGILFVGIGFMQDAFGGLKDSEKVVAFLGGLGTKPLLALLAGTIVTMLVQSSSASIGIVLVLAGQGAFGQDWTNVLNAAIPFVLGANIGTTITAQIAAFNTNLGSRRTAWAHTLFNVVGALIVLPFIVPLPFFPEGLFAKLVMFISNMFWETGEQTIGLTISVAHTLFNVTVSLMFLPMSGILEKLAISIVRPKAGEIIEKPVVLEEHLLETPVLALEQARRELIRMAGKAKSAVVHATTGLTTANMKEIDKARRNEQITDEFQNEITTYLVQLSSRQLADEVSIELPVLLHMVNDLERVGDHAVNIAEIAERMIELKLTFSESAAAEAKQMIDEVIKMFDGIIVSLENSDPAAARKALLSENKINRMQVKYRRSHVERMTKGKCSARSGLIFIDLVDNIEKIGDHLTNVGQSVSGGLRWDGIDGNTLSGEFKAITE